ncbi:hypothetical protein LEP1GSC024_1687 [Leptospira noguchii str. 2001034031]|uniref:Uncharacterized protein n=2 Tax=Leptospira noguchii str. 2001034031 TaxID=1193053 RepID=M6YHI7_9LEPT|nr:hypothetical protein LEP1GSC024_1687 [Leptospira noguchii str. 2001034031]
MKIDGEFIFQELYCIWISRQLKDEIKEPEFRRVNVDTTVQEKAITFPTDAKLYHRMRQALVKEASKENIQLRQSYKNLPHQFLR